LELTNHVAAHAAAVREGRWAASPDFCFTVAPLVELSGKTLAIIGLGAIGQRVARIGAALGMNIATIERGKPIDIPNIPVRTMPLDELFAAADVLTLHCPLTDESRAIVNAARLAIMKPTAFLINASRGPLVDETALAEALRDNRLAGAALDVLSSEPPRADNPLVRCPRTIITPHVAWATLEARRRLLAIAADNIAAYLAGKAQNVVRP
jgi:glycerate dehydrogenase